MNNKNTFVIKAQYSKRVMDVILREKKKKKKNEILTHQTKINKQ